MKRLIVVCLVMFLAVPALAWEIRDTPQDIVLSEPLTDQIALIGLRFVYGTNSYAAITYAVIDSNNRVISEHTVRVRNALDNPTSITANCTGAGEPWPLCTGAGTCTNDCDESTTDFTDFVAGYGATMKSRGDSKVWTDIQNRYDTQPKP